MNHKTRYTAEGRIYMVPADQKLDETAYGTYSWDGLTRTIKVPGHEPVKNRLSITGDLMTIAFDTGRRLTYRRMSGDRPWDRILEPRSLEVLRTSQPAPLLRYDTSDHSKLSFPQRIQGVWEVAGYAAVRYEVPPYGLPNDKYVVTSTEVAMIPPDRTSVPADAKSRYQIQPGNTLLVDGERWQVTFDRWQRMVIRRDQDEITLRLVQKATSPIPRLPVTVALLPEE